MFFRQIDDFEENFKFLDRLNVLLFNVWRDKQADAFKTQSMDQLEMFYRNYVNEMRQKSHEMSLLLKQIDENIARLDRLRHDIGEIAMNPEIEGCWLCTASGTVDREYDRDVRENFVARSNELGDQLEAIAEERTSIFPVEEAFTHSKL